MVGLLVVWLCATRMGRLVAKPISALPEIRDLPCGWIILVCLWTESGSVCPGFCTVGGSSKLARVALVRVVGMARLRLVGVNYTRGFVFGRRHATQGDLGDLSGIVGRGRVVDGLLAETRLEY